jgi:hypothetical protein
MKRTLTLAITIAALSVSAFGQEVPDTWNGNRRMAVTLDPSPLVFASFLGGFGIEAGFEYALAQSASLKVNSQFATIRLTESADSAPDIDALRAWLLRVNLEGRWYPQGMFVQGWFFSGNLQFQTATASFSMFDTGERVMDSASRYALSFFPGFGYKLVFGSNRRTSFALEANGSVGFRIVSNIPDFPAGFFEAWLLGAAGPRASLLLGVAF